ncbi:DEAD/DEAH box helicase [Providencia sp. JGM181]|uniref:DEAD/DEAH box helicase n=1 Tax=unclassified Providencia TaxID=2633465 RepID=UPI001BA9B04C|nr:MULTISPECIES: DEAD/DEAH box helicase [unclassified Providencia]MBS0923570.1 DEAD/DEAH box helicase [Providencia sp. JGM181]MBS0934620.1 DEAD/DEAH box helicase [Providencia sp. JGM172]MBS0998436.1 DEAD/DEAH box helicase [Providencia sp. JGM178]
MTLSFEQLQSVDNHWAVQAIDSATRDSAFDAAKDSLVNSALGSLFTGANIEVDYASIEQVASAYELAAIEGITTLLSPSSAEQQTKNFAIAGANKAFGLMRVLPIPEDVDQRVFHVLHMAGLAYAGDRWTDLRRWFEEHEQDIQVPSVADAAWNKRVVFRLFDAWVRLLRKRSWDDLDQIAEIIVGLRHDQALHERVFLDQAQGAARQSEAIRLVSLYHWAKATERLSTYMLQGEPLAIESELDQHFEAAIKAAQLSCDTKLEMLLRWLHVASRKMVEGSVWWVAHSVNSRVTRFVDHVTRHKSMFELLPPQRAALQEQNLLDPASRAVVIDMPTSGGKTQLAQFRMLQALNQFADEGGWIAYVAPTRALVSQITRRLRSDFGALGIKVEQLTGAIEVDAFENALLGEQEAFQVLVATPEKLQLVMRNKKIQRPLALLVMDEAHNIEDNERGLRIELLLATIKQEASRANFLLLMPFVPNANELAQWLGSGRGKSISLSTSAWQPNERIVGLFDSEQAEGRGNWKLTFETLTTTQRTIHLCGKQDVDGIRPIRSLNYSSAQSLSKQAAAMAKVFSKRGTSIAVAQKIPDVWSIARLIANELEPLDRVPEEVALVQRFLRTEISHDFELIGMLEKGVVVHHAGLPAEALALIEWLTEEGHIKIMCATTTIAQGLNFPVSSVFLASPKYPYGIKMSHREFWNLAGRAGRIGHDSVGVVGIAAGTNPNEIRQFVSDATGDLLSRLVSMLEEIDSVGGLSDLSAVIHQEQWADFRSYIAHLWNEKRNLDEVIAEAEQLLRNTYGFSSLRAKPDTHSQQQADALLEATKGYVRQIAEHPENAALADSTGFSPEGVRTALLELNRLENKLTTEDWQPSSLFGSDAGRSALPDLMGVMMRVPQLQKSLTELGGDGIGHQRLADITRAWVDGSSLEDIANRFFDEGDLTNNLSKACKAVYRDLANNGAWGLSALSKMPTAGIDFDNLSAEELRTLNNLPAMLYHGVRSEEGVLMRMNSVPRSIAESLGADFKLQHRDTDTASAPSLATGYISALSSDDWSRLRPEGASMSGDDYRKVWEQLSGT